MDEQMPGSSSGRTITVLESFRQPRATTNPYISQLLTALRTRAEVQTFSWRRALTGGFDVFHIHWPEVVFTRASGWRTAVLSVLFVLVLVRMRMSRTAIVRTAHNLEPHDGTSRLTASVLSLCDRWTTLWIRLNPETPAPGGAEVRTILHGHYRDWYADFARSGQVPGRALFFGQVRPYKGVDELLSVFADVPAEADLSLLIAGRANDPAYGASVARSAHGDPRVRLDLSFVDDDTLVGYLGEAQLVVLPYQEMHNSGALLLALSLDRPVLVPANPITDALAAEVGEKWVMRYHGSLTPSVLIDSVVAAASLVGESPHLDVRGWSSVADAHIAAYRAAIAARRR